MVRSYFDIKRAETLVPSLSMLVRRAQELKIELDQRERLLRRQLLAGGETDDGFEFQTYDAERNNLEDEFYKVVEKLESTGAILRDVEDGIVEFYSKFEGQDVFLSWQVGERKIKHWRTPEMEQRAKILEMR